MSVVGRVVQQSADVQDYDLDFGAQWLPQDDWIARCDISCVPSMAHPPTVVLEPGSKPRIAKVWVYQDSPEGKYKLQITAFSEDGRRRQAELMVTIKEV